MIPSLATSRRTCTLHAIYSCHTASHAAGRSRRGCGQRPPRRRKLRDNCRMWAYIPSSHGLPLRILVVKWSKSPPRRLGRALGCLLSYSAFPPQSTPLKCTLKVTLKRRSLRGCIYLKDLKIYLNLEIYLERNRLHPKFTNPGLRASGRLT